MPRVRTSPHTHTHTHTHTSDILTGSSHPHSPRHAHPGSGAASFIRLQKQNSRGSLTQTTVVSTRACVRACVCVCVCELARVASPYLGHAGRPSREPDSTEKSASPPSLCQLSSPSSPSFRTTWTGVASRYKCYSDGSSEHQRIFRERSASPLSSHRAACCFTSTKRKEWERERERDRRRERGRERGRVSWGGGGCLFFLFLFVLTKQNPSYSKKPLKSTSRQKARKQRAGGGASAQVVVGFKSTLRRLVSVPLHSIPSPS